MLKHFITIVLLLAATLISIDAQQNNSITVSSFNLRFDTPADGENAWPNRKKFVIDLIRYHEFDIIGSQEVLHNQVEDLLKMDEFSHYGKGRDDGKTGGEHCTIFFKKERFKLLDSGDFWLSETPENPSLGWDATCCHRICTWIKLKDNITDNKFYVFNSHFDHQGEVARLESGKLMQEKINKIAGSSPVIFTGDLNSVPESRQVQIITNKLKDAFKVSEAPPYGPEGTFNGFDLNAQLKNRIDYIFLSSHFKVQKYAALTDFLDGRFPSDHLPVVAKISFK
ncbi:endonuclease/exonuclease/phosphatase family protein [Marinilabiliaceae bacterium ANBcel2]|nr:endonuclease/exonuclease/phosphatase family protein [Marinilabiliaceae bacterium ANBcel2]